MKFGHLEGEQHNPMFTGTKTITMVINHWTIHGEPILQAWLDVARHKGGLPIAKTTTFVKSFMTMGAWHALTPRVTDVIFFGGKAFWVESTRIAKCTEKLTYIDDQWTKKHQSDMNHQIRIGS